VYKAVGWGPEKGTAKLNLTTRWYVKDCRETTTQKMCYLRGYARFGWARAAAPHGKVDRNENDRSQKRRTNEDYCRGDVIEPKNNVDCEFPHGQCHL